MGDSGERVGWIGLGKMGRPMIGHLLARGDALLVFDPVPEALQSAHAAGARVAGSIAELARDCTIVISMIPNDTALGAVALGPGSVLANLPPGGIYVDMSTVSPVACARVREAADGLGIDYLAAPVSGSTATAAAAALTVMVSGQPAALDRVRPFFDAFSKKLFYVGAGVEARYVKLALNHLVGSTAQLVAEALTLGRKGGVRWDILLDVLGQSVVASPLIAYKLDPLRRRDFTPAFTTLQMVKDMSLVAEAMAATGVSGPLADAVLRLFKEQAETALATQDFFAAVKDVEGRAGLAEP